RHHRARLLTVERLALIGDALEGVEDHTCSESGVQRLYGMRGFRRDFDFCKPRPAATYGP
ncbi:MAG: hypothetical protein WCA16_04960, partial [Candidatus Sulfotelmatobacter sp.]